MLHSPPTAHKNPPRQPRAAPFWLSLPTRTAGRGRPLPMPARSTHPPSANRPEPLSRTLHYNVSVCLCASRRPLPGSASLLSAFLPTHFVTLLYVRPRAPPLLSPCLYSPFNSRILRQVGPQVEEAVGPTAAHEGMLPAARACRHRQSMLSPLRPLCSLPTSALFLAIASNFCGATANRSSAPLSGGLPGDSIFLQSAAFCAWGHSSGAPVACDAKAATRPAPGRVQAPASTADRRRRLRPDARVPPSCCSLPSGSPSAAMRAPATPPLESRRVCIVTGATNGLGRSAARCLPPAAQPAARCTSRPQLQLRFAAAPEAQP